MNDDKELILVPAILQKLGLTNLRVIETVVNGKPSKHLSFLYHDQPFLSCRYVEEDKDTAEQFMFHMGAHACLTVIESILKHECATSPELCKQLDKLMETSTHA